MRKFAVAAFVCVVVQISIVGSLNADAQRPGSGVWGFCASSAEVGCVRSVTVTPPNGPPVEVKNADGLSRARVTLKVECPPSAKGCSSELPAINCASESANLPSLVVTATAEEVPTRLLLEIATGSFVPRFAIGSGTRSLTVSSEASGDHVVVIDTTVDEIPMALNSPIPVPDPSSPGYSPNEYLAKYAEWIETATADGGTKQAVLTLKPTIDGSCNPKFEGVWLDFNSQGFSLESLIGGPANCPPTITCSGTVKLKIQLKAFSPHFKRPRSGVEPEINPARIVVFLPTALLSSMGYYDTTTFDAQSFAVTLRDGSTTTPRISRQVGGILVDLGVEHYSQPDPVFEIKVGSSPAPVIAPTTTVGNSSQSGLTLTKGRQISLTALAKRASLVVGSGSRVNAVVAQKSKTVCAVAINVLRALRQGECRLNLTSIAKSGKRVTKTLLIQIV